MAAQEMIFAPLLHKHSDTPAPLPTGAWFGYVIATETAIAAATLVITIINFARRHYGC